MNSKFYQIFRADLLNLIKIEYLYLNIIINKFNVEK